MKIKQCPTNNDIIKAFYNSATGCFKPYVYIKEKFKKDQFRTIHKSFDLPTYHAIIYHR